MAALPFHQHCDSPDEAAEAALRYVEVRTLWKMHLLQNDQPCLRPIFLGLAKIATRKRRILMTNPSKWSSKTWGDVSSMSFFFLSFFLSFFFSFFLSLPLSLSISLSPLINQFFSGRNAVSGLWLQSPANNSSWESSI